MVHVNDASRAVGVASSLLSPERREAYAADIRAEYAKISAAHFRAQADKKRLKLADARANAMKIDFAKTPPKKPAFLGIRSFDDYDLAELAEYIDWTPFFQTWELTGRFPAILDDPKVGEVARSLYDDARKMLDLHHQGEMVHGARHHRLLAGQCRRRRHRGLCRRQPQDSRSRPSTRCASSWRSAKAASTPRCRTSSRRSSSGVPDYIGAFVVTAGIGEDVVADRFKNANDDYSSILCKALADRLAEAFAERMHAARAQANSGATRRTRRWRRIS